MGKHVWKYGDVNVYVPSEHDTNSLWLERDQHGGHGIY